ncbi:MAG: hypothetical protein J6M62_00875 [Selenomonadaceae bacterium]|nr:hypothetical protein [Selenomonadaceae bacterium]MBP3722819.1 hypothetical protein [Selenomonadaceae bacterium]
MFDTIIFVIDVVLIIILLGLIGIKLYLAYIGKENVVVTPSGNFSLVEKNNDNILLETSVVFKNIGTSCATIMDAICRPQLPYEQYDKIEARGKAEWKDAPREDDYFEAVLIYKKGDERDEITIVPKVRLTARKGASLEEALKGMPDINIELIWLETGRVPVNYKKIILRLNGDDVRKLANI